MSMTLSGVPDDVIGCMFDRRSAVRCFKACRSLAAWTWPLYLPTSAKKAWSLLQWARHRNSAINAERSIERKKVVQPADQREASLRVDGLVLFDGACRRGERNGCGCEARGVQAFVVVSRVDAMKPSNGTITPGATPPRPGATSIADAIWPRCCRGRCSPGCAGNLGRDQVWDLPKAFTERRNLVRGYGEHIRPPDRPKTTSQCPFWNRSVCCIV
jgi:hypothetical protein